MGCDFYLMTRLWVEYKDGKGDYVELDEERRWYVDFDGMDDMTYDEWEECDEKYGNLELDKVIIIYENGNFVNEEYEREYTNKLLGYQRPLNIRKGNKTMNDVKNIKIVQEIRDR